MPQKPELQEVFTVSGIPKHTFVKPNEYTRLLVALKTAGRGIVIEGPSGIGKTTAITKALEEVGMAEKVLKLSARREGLLTYTSSTGLDHLKNGHCHWITPWPSTKSLGAV